MFKSGTLWREVVECSARAIRSGAQESITTEEVFVADAGVEFLVRVVSSLQRKSASHSHRPLETGHAQQSDNPFLPYEEALLVAELSSTHVALLNKYNVVAHHLLLVTRSFEEQLSPLSAADFSAFTQCLSEVDGLGFYNAGAVAGASQRHKHLQLVRLPLASRGSRIPIEPLLPTEAERGQIHRLTHLPFRHAFANLEVSPETNPTHAARELHQIYASMLNELALARGDLTAPYNLLVTRSWMLLVPRLQEHFETVSINALGFAGALLVRTSEELELLARRGPMTALGAVGAPPE